MSNEPEHKAARQLKAYAERRRQETGGPTEMSAATRQRLMSEVVRVYGPEPGSPGARSGWWSLVSWPRLSFAGSIFALVVAGLVWMEREREREKFMLDTARIEAPGADSKSPLDAALGTGSPQERAPIIITGREVATSTPATPDLLSAASKQSPSSVTPELPAGAETPLAATAPSIAEALPAPALEPANRELPPPTPASRPISAPESLSRARFARQPESQPARDNFNPPPPPNVLNHFQVEQEGNQLRVVDEDGSTYLGHVEPAPSPISLSEARGALRQESSLPAQKQSGQTESAVNLYFKVTGTNRSLNQKVVFEGNYFPNATPVAATGTAPAQRGVALRSADAATTRTRIDTLSSRQSMPWSNQAPAFSNQSNPLSNQSLPRIQGRATVGATKQVAVDAVPSTP
jgi:hypothetical protein